MQKDPSTTAYLRISSQDFSKQSIHGEVIAGEFIWDFNWNFKRGELLVSPPLGRALIHDALLRFLIKSDYSLEVGSDYTFKVRAKF